MCLTDWKGRYSLEHWRSTLSINNRKLKTFLFFCTYRRAGLLSQRFPRAEQGVSRRLPKHWGLRVFSWIKTLEQTVPIQFKSRFKKPLNLAYGALNQCHEKSLSIVSEAVPRLDFWSDLTTGLPNVLQVLKCSFPNYGDLTNYPQAHEWKEMHELYLHFLPSTNALKMQHKSFPQSCGAHKSEKNYLLVCQSPVLSFSITCILQSVCSHGRKKLPSGLRFYSLQTERKSRFDGRKSVSNRVTGAPLSRPQERANHNKTAFVERKKLLNLKKLSSGDDGFSGYSLKQQSRRTAFHPPTSLTLLDAFRNFTHGFQWRFYKILQ